MGLPLWNDHTCSGQTGNLSTKCPVFFFSAPLEKENGEIWIRNGNNQRSIFDAEVRRGREWACVYIYIYQRTARTERCGSTAHSRQLQWKAEQATHRRISEPHVDGETCGRIHAFNIAQSILSPLYRGRSPSTPGGKWTHTLWTILISFGIDIVLSLVWVILKTTPEIKISGHMWVLRENHSFIRI